MDSRRLVVTGPESTGKSSLSAGLSAELNMPWVPEYARTYLELLPRKYTYDDLWEIALGQRASERSAPQAPLLILDTDLLVLEVWYLWVFGRVPEGLEELIQSQRPGYYLLCNIDLPWEPDPLREHPQHRQELFDLHRERLEARGLPYAVVSGRDQLRLESALQVVQREFPLPGRE